MNKSKKIEDLLKSTKDDTLKSVLFNLRLVPTFSLMIDATYEPIHQFLVGQYPTLDSDSINSIIVAATCQFIFKTYDRFKQGKDLKALLDSRGLVEKVDETKTALTKLFKMAADVLKDMGYTTATMSGILGFATILQPFMSGINELMQRNTDFSLDNLFNYIVLGLTFKGALFVEQFLNKFVKQFEKEPDVVPSRKVEKKKAEESDTEEYLSETQLKSIIDSIVLQ